MRRQRNWAHLVECKETSSFVVMQRESVTTREVQKTMARTKADEGRVIIVIKRNKGDQRGEVKSRCSEYVSRII